MKKAATSIDVARLAGLSQSTVSRAFDPNSSVAPETRARVLAAAAELDYKPNVIARSLSTQRSDIIGIIMANINNSLFYPLVLEEFTRKLQELGKQVLLFNVPPDRPVDEILPRVLGYQVDGLIITSTTPSNEIVDECARLGKPVVLFNRLVRGTNANIVSCDNVAGSHLVADALLDSGHQRIAAIAGIATTSTSELREKGFSEQLKKRGYHNLLRERGSFTYESGYEAALRLLDCDNPPDAIYCMADIMALGAMDAARYQLGIKIPDELSIIGFDDIPVANYPAYSLTTIRQPISAMIESVIELLAREDGEFPTAEVRLLPGELVVRQSARLHAAR
jgi:DNA-binding LacI/PurR family transcriptional regulator